MEVDADTAPHSSSSSLAGGAYEVFLSFRSPDTRHGFTDYLYNSLIQSGVRAYRDEEELPPGGKISPELDKSIRDSRISIPIFSERYADSESCLRELVLMLQCQSRGQLILPVFYHVTTNEVELQPAESTFGTNFKNLQESGEFSDDDIEQWKNALVKAVEHKGWELKKDGKEGELILHKIVPRVLSELKIKLMDVTPKLVGMDHRQKEMTRLLNISSDDVQIVGIYGMTGIGKTTVAKFIYNDLLGNFDRCSFLADVQMVEKRKGSLVSLQKQLLTDTLKWSRDIANVDEGKAIIREKFRNTKVLIVVDDVHSKKQFDTLVVGSDCFGEGSKIILTTKNIGVLDALKVEWTYELPILDAVESLQLFSKHAFDMEFPPNEEYDRISREIASFAGGLPLALESMGLDLSGEEDLEIWEAASKKFAEKLTDDVGKKLNVDYEALNEGQKQIFLDVACLFAGMDKTIVSYLWDGCGYDPKIEFNELYHRSLVKVGDANELWMHNQLIALGKKIVNEGISLGNRSRLWNHEEAELILEGRMGTEKVEALSLSFNLDSGEKPCFTSEDFTKLVNLRYLQVDGANLSGNFERVLLSLRWLNWRGCPLNFNPTNFRMKNLVLLDLSNSGITEEWEGWRQIQMERKLKVLLVADCALRRTPYFSSCEHLEILNLGHFQSLFDIDPSIANLKNLKVLKISYEADEIWMLKYLKARLQSVVTGMWTFLGRIRSLPASISELTQLETLNLRVLNVDDISNLTSLVNLKELQLFECNNLVEMPSDFWKLFKLEKLTLDRTKIWSLPVDIGLLPQLKVLNIQSCGNLQRILGLPSSLVELSLASCDSLERLPDLSNLNNLSSLLLKNCGELVWVEGLGNLELLTSLYIFECKMLANSGNMLDLSNLNELETLSICNCSQLVKIQGLGGLESLKYLDLRDCNNLREIEGIESSISLQVLDVLRCTSEISRITIQEMPQTRIRIIEDEINAADSVQRYWTELRERKLNLREPV